MTTLTFNILATDKASGPIGGVAKKLGALSQGITGAGRSSDGLKSKFGKLGDTAGGVLGKGLRFGALGAAGLGAGLVALAPKVFESAASLDLMGRKSATVFGTELPRVQAWADKSAFSMGLTTREAIGLAAGMSDLLVPMGFSRKAAADMSTKVTGLSGALAEWSGGTRSATEVSEILNSALLGERDALKGLGIGISEAQVSAQVLTNKKRGLRFATDEQAKAQATLDLILAKSTDAQKAFAGGAGSLARRMAESKARLADVGQTLLVTATPALTALAGVLQKHVVPQLVRFGDWLAGPGKFVVADAFLTFGESATAFGVVVLKTLKFVLGASLDFAGRLLDQMTIAFGWIPEIGPKLKNARDSFNGFRVGVDDSLTSAIGTLGDWNTAAKKMRDTVAVKANIADLESKLKTAKTALSDPKLTAVRKAKLGADITMLQVQLGLARSKQLLADPKLTQTRKAKLTADIVALQIQLDIARSRKELADPALTKERKATLTANIAELQKKLATARSKQQLADPNLVATRKSKLTSDITELQRRLTTAKTELKNPQLTATKRSKLTADILSLQQQLARAKHRFATFKTQVNTELGGIKDHSIGFVIRYTSTGVNLSTPSSVGRRATGGPGGPVRGPGSTTSDTAGLYALSNREWVIKAASTTRYGDKAMQAVNEGKATIVLPDGSTKGFATGGSPGAFRLSLDVGGAKPDRIGDIAARAARIVAKRDAITLAATGGSLARVIGWARTQDRKPYIWGGVGPRGFDCSGWVSALVNMAYGRPPYRRLGATGSMPWPMFAPGRGPFMVGWFKGNPGHTAATINGVNLESRGGDGVVIGSRARGADHPLFSRRMKVRGFAAGGKVGDPPFDLLDPRGKAFLGWDALRQLAPRNLADGGVIAEHILGIGLRSGRRYQFGERGPERVTPMSRVDRLRPPRRGGGDIHITVNGAVDRVRTAQEIRELLLNLKRTYRSDLGLS
jgi:cell wall-associated NlpC family hydrolase